MASSAPNPHGQPHASNTIAARPTPSAKLHPDDNLEQFSYAAHSSLSQLQQQQNAALNRGLGGTSITQEQQQGQTVAPSSSAVSVSAGFGSGGSDNRQHMLQDESIDGQTRALLHSSALLASTNYDAGYYGGVEMSSDSELTTSGAGIRHSHHLYHPQRPYSSQSRVYYAHPAPRNSQHQQSSASSSSRLSHYSVPSVAQSTNMQSSSIPQANLPGTFMGNAAAALQHPGTRSSGSTATNQQNQLSSMGHQGSFSPSSSASSAYLAGSMATNESPVGPVMPQQHQQQQQQQLAPPNIGNGRQLPQRPFKQSISIDHHQSSFATTGGAGAAGSHYSAQISGDHHTSPVRHQRMGMSTGTAQQMVHDYHHHQSSISAYQSRFDQAANRGMHQHHDLEMVEKQTADMTLYDTNEQARASSGQVTGLPPTGIMRPTSSSSPMARQLPNVGQQHQTTGLAGPTSLDHRHQHMHSVDSYHHHHHQQKQHQIHPQIHHQPTDPYTVANQHATRQHQAASGSSDWLPPTGLSNHQYARSQTALPFKQTMSIDHYQSNAPIRHYSPLRGSHADVANDNQYHSFGSYNASTKQQQKLIESYDSPTSQQQQAYYSALSSSSLLGANHHSDPANTVAYYQQQPLETAGHRQHHLQHEGPNVSSSEYKMKAGPSPSASINANAPHSHQQSSQVVQSKQLHHQTSDISSNSNLSGSFKVSQVDSGCAGNKGTFEKQTSSTAASNNEHQKSISSASSHHHQSPGIPDGSIGNDIISHNHHYAPKNRQDIFRRGFTSVAVTSGGYGSELGGSQSALSDAGDLSLSQTSHSGGGANPGKRHALRAASPSIPVEGSSSSGHHHHHSASSAYGQSVGMRSESTTGLPDGPGSSSTLTKKSNSATQLSMSGTKKRLGFRKKQVTSFSVHRSEEVAPLEARHLVKQGSSVSEGDSSMSGDSSSRSWSNSNFKQHTSDELASMSFIDGLGKGQMISRQGLASPYLGDIQLSLCDRRGNLEIEVIRARKLQAKTNKILPLTYVKLYLVKNRKCLAKAKTTLSNKRTLDPLFQQQLTFHEDYHGCILQSIVWGNFGKMDKKNFMGIAQISIDDLELSDTVISWYKLFLPSSLQTLPSKSLRHTLLSNSTESFTNTTNS